MAGLLPDNSCDTAKISTTVSENVTIPILGNLQRINVYGFRAHAQTIKNQLANNIIHTLETSCALWHSTTYMQLPADSLSCPDGPHSRALSVKEGN